jgi:shikimate kinase
MLRRKVDDVDQKMAALLEQRLKLVLEIMEEKKHQRLPIFSKDREAEVIERVGNHVRNPLLKEEVRFIHQYVVQSCRRIQSRRLFPYHITLVGFMGSGKTTVGVELSKLLAMEQIDVDHVIEDRTKMRISEIFEHFGEKTFRKMESDVVEELSKRHNVIIFCSGGGVVLNESNVEHIKRTGVVVWLKASAEEIFRRIKDDDSRPLLKDDMTVEKIAAMLKDRRHLYEGAADLVIDTDGKTVEAVSCEIVERLMEKEFDRRVDDKDIEAVDLVPRIMKSMDSASESYK